MMPATCTRPNPWLRSARAILSWLAVSPSMDVMAEDLVFFFVPFFFVPPRIEESEDEDDFLDLDIFASDFVDVDSPITASSGHPPPTKLS